MVLPGLFAGMAYWVNVKIISYFCAFLAVNNPINGTIKV